MPGPVASSADLTGNLSFYSGKKKKNQVYDKCAYQSDGRNRSTLGHRCRELEIQHGGLNSHTIKEEEGKLKGSRIVRLMWMHHIPAVPRLQRVAVTVQTVTASTSGESLFRDFVLLQADVWLFFLTPMKVN